MERDIDSLIERFTREQKERIATARAEGVVSSEKSGPKLLNSLLAGTLREVGHTQMVLLADKGFPITHGVETIDIALSADVPTVLDVIRAISDEFSFDRVLITDEMQALSPQRVKELEALTGKPFEVCPHVEFKEIAAYVRLAVRTGDATPYANCILVCG